ncbi:hypothetical protein [Metabacillus fastidiosus]|uniref:hypothetical protein n=1 Tax=Metabacillus fastidiosus TaxID=1458 RepID=UPI003D29497B
MSKLIRHGEEWRHSETGELFTKERLDELNNKKLFEEHNTYLKNSIDHELKPQYKLIKLRDSKESSKMTIKEGYKFNMTHRTDVKDLLLNNKLTVQEFAFIGAFTPFITYPDNDLKINNEYLSLEELSEFCSYSKNIMTRTIKKLESLEIIKVIKGGNRPPIIYFNPFLYSAGRDVSRDTFMMFSKSIYNPDVAYYQ